MKKKCIFITLALLLNLTLAGCWSSHEVNTLGLTVAIGIDKTDGGYLISEQLINPKAIASQRATDEAPVTVYTAEGPNIPEAINKMAALATRAIYSSHLRMVILSEEIAKEGISDILDYFLRYHEYRTDFYFAVARGSSAKDILTILTPIEAIPGISMFDKLELAYKTWASTKNVRIIELSNDITAKGTNPVIGAVEISGADEKPDRTEILRKSENFEKLKFSDLGAFKNDKLAGWLSASESKGYNYIKGTVERTTEYASENENEVTFEILKAKSKIKPSVKDNSPEAAVEISVECAAIAVKGGLEVSKEENTETVSGMLKEKITQMCRESLEKAQKELNTDIFGFGEKIHAHDPDYWKTVMDSWNDVFVDMPVDIKVDVKVLATGDMTKSITQRD